MGVFDENTNKSGEKIYYQKFAERSFQIDLSLFGGRECH